MDAPGLSICSLLVASCLLGCEVVLYMELDILIGRSVIEPENNFKPSKTGQKQTSIGGLDCLIFGPYLCFGSLICYGSVSILDLNFRPHFLDFVKIVLYIYMTILF